MENETTRQSEIVAKYNFKFSETVCNEAFQYSKRMLYNTGLAKSSKELRGSISQILIPNYVLDSNFDEIVDKTDIVLEQYQANAPYGYANISNLISTVQFDHPSGNTIVNTSQPIPTDSSYTIKISYYRGVMPYDNSKEDIRLLQELYFIEYLFMSLDPYKLQQGMTTKELNGVTITYDKAAIDAYRKQLRSQIGQLSMNIQGFGFENDNANVLFSKNYKATIAKTTRSTK